MAKAKKTGKIRMTMIRADTHGYYFGAIMAKCDPLLLMKHNKIVHYYFTDWYDEKHLTHPKVWDFEIVNVWDYEFKRAEEMCETFFGKPKPCRTLEEATKGVDCVYLGDCDGGGGDHLKLARPFIRKGIPTFVDKPFALTLKDAKAIVALARKHRTPIYNSSILSVTPAGEAFKRRLAELTAKAAPWYHTSQAAVAMQCSVNKLGKILGVVKGVGGAMSQENIGARDQIGGIEDRLAYIIHGIALAIHVFGTGVEWVEAMGTLPMEFLHLHMKNGNDVLIMNPGVDVFPEACSFYVEAYSKMGAIHSEHIGDPEFMNGAHVIVQNIRKMVRTGKAPRSYDDIIEQIAVVDAGQIAQQTGKRIFIKDVLSGKVKLKTPARCRGNPVAASLMIREKRAD